DAGIRPFVEPRRERAIARLKGTAAACKADPFKDSFFIVRHGRKASQECHQERLREKGGAHHEKEWIPES
ncbi:MAG: hypothetical protein WA886_12160, partial [Candidatus Acidiferrales bacterium]